MDSEFIKKNKGLFVGSDYADKGIEILKQMEVIKEFLDRFDKSRIKDKNKFQADLDSLLERLNRQAMELNDNGMIKKVKSLFRKHNEKHILESPLCKHGYLKPKGFAGDYQIIESIYNNEPMAQKNTMGLMFDMYLLDAEYVKAVRDRKDMMKEMLRDFILKSELKNLKILNIACGSCREIRELIQKGFKTDKIVDFVLVDQDGECLEFSKKALASAPKNYRFHYMQKNAVMFFRDSELEKKFGKFDFIYSIGLADYLANLILGDTIQKGFNRLRDGGEFIVAHKNVKEVDSVRSDWICDWDFIPRDTEDIDRVVKEYLSDEANYVVGYRYLKSRLIFFLIIHKKR